MSVPSAPEAPASASGGTPGINPAVRNAVRLCLSAKEYRALYYIAGKRAPALQSKLSSALCDDSATSSRSRHNLGALRASMRVFVGTGLALKLFELVMSRVKGEAAKTKTRTPLLRSPNFRLSISLSLLLLLHRLIYRFLARLRSNLRSDDARPFRERNPHISRALTSRYAPAVGASLAGFALGGCPQDQLRLTAAIWTSTKSLEYLYDALDINGLLGKCPWWFGSWLLMPVSCAQLFHAFVFDRETTPKWFEVVVRRLSMGYIQDRPASLSADVAWPEKEQIVDSLSSIADLRWPSFVSPILHPNDPNTLPAAVKAISPITGPAHPSIANLACALLHPSLPGCSTAFLHQILLSVPRVARLIGGVVLVYGLIGFKRIKAQPLAAISGMLKKVLVMTTILSTSLASLWGSVCLLNNRLPGSTLPTKRFFLSGAMGSLPFLLLSSNRGLFTYFFRAAVDSAWKTGVKRKLWKGTRRYELTVFVLSWALMGSILDSTPDAVQGGGVRKALSWLRGDGFADPVEAEKRKAERASKKVE
ncbi:uncharacterized protein N7483_006927 [Penicillium malachiteum]|uniref:uncharacterized protein n=1 Tax=Penicillium malachiteum TaxID=1324776 RepID=UPI0025481BF7|nr:uncharacterized protein N7483_006927 [Penicillium malachiteum]KAJ5725570.1 hypothetical protein N7483_006927 [Penicillium malachiteum]